MEVERGALQSGERKGEERRAEHLVGWSRFEIEENWGRSR
jgi:hypothetical protein